MPEFECFVRGCETIVEADSGDEAKAIYYELLLSELSANDIEANELHSDI